jgi:hypothetical protein
MSDPTNGERQESAFRALLAHLNGQPLDDDPTTDVIDLVANLMHLCDREGLDWSEIINMAKLHHGIEVEKERNAATGGPSNGGS